MTVSIIIPTLNEAAGILHSIERAWRAGADEVIVADGGSQDGTLELAQSAECLLTNSPPGRGPQLNQGAELATSEFLLFLHADNWLAPDACEQIRERENDSSMMYGGFKQRIENPASIYRWIESGNAMRIRFRSLVYGDQAFFIRRSLFDRVGGFPAIPIMEDLEICRKLKTMGKPLLLPGPTHVGDRRWSSFGPVRQTIKNWFLSSAYLMGASPQWLASQYRPHDQST